MVDLFRQRRNIKVKIVHSSSSKKYFKKPKHHDSTEKKLQKGSFNRAETQLRRSPGPVNLKQPSRKEQADTEGGQSAFM